MFSMCAEFCGLPSLQTKARLSRGRDGYTSGPSEHWALSTCHCPALLLSGSELSLLFTVHSEHLSVSYRLFPTLDRNRGHVLWSAVNICSELGHTDAVWENHVVPPKNHRRIFQEKLCKHSNDHSLQTHTVAYYTAAGVSDVHTQVCRKQWAKCSKR